MQQRSLVQWLAHLVGLALFPVLAAVFTVRDQAFDYTGDAADRFDQFAAEPDLYAAQALTFLAMQFALVPAALAFLWIVRGRGRGGVILGSALLVVSALGHAAFSGAQLLVHRMIVDGTTEQMGEVFVAFDTSTQFMAAAAPGLVGLVFGMLLLGLGTLASRELPWWVGLSLVLFVFAEFGLGSVSDAGPVIGVVLLFLAFWGAAWHTWRGGRAGDGHAGEPVLLVD